MAHEPIQFEANDQKFQELIVHIATKSEGDRPFGATKLNKLLFYSDFCAFLSLGKPITGQDYQKLEHGPCPRALKPTLREMSNQGRICEAIGEYCGFPQKRVVPQRAANLEVFNAKEISLVDELIADFWNRTATEMSNMSHSFIGWRLAEIGETIPYAVAWVGSRQPTPDDYRIGNGLEKLAQECLVSGQPQSRYYNAHSGFSAVKNKR